MTGLLYPQELRGEIKSFKPFPTQFGDVGTVEVRVECDHADVKTVAAALTETIERLRRESLRTPAR